MRIQYHCTGSFENEELQALLIEQNIIIKKINDEKFVFDIFSDNFRLEDILNALEKENNKITIVAWKGDTTAVRRFFMLIFEKHAPL